MPALPNTAVAVGSGRRGKPNAVEVPLTPGYVARGVSGLHPVTRSYNAIWRRLSETEKQTLIAFFEARGGHESFTFQAPGDSVSRAWIAKDWRETSERGGLWSVKADLREVVL